MVKRGFLARGSGGIWMGRTIDFSIELGDIATFEADVVGLKFAQHFFGADRAVADSLVAAGLRVENLCPGVGRHVYIETRNAIHSPKVVFVGVEPLGSFGYRDIREFAASVVKIVSNEDPGAEHLAMTLHGPGYGLDEVEALFSLFAGILQALRDAIQISGWHLRCISIVERDRGRVERLRTAFQQRESQFELNASRGRWPYLLSIGGEHRQDPADPSPSRSVEEVGRGSEQKPHVFVAMPFAKNWEDVFYYGIQGPVRAAGYLCERVDQDAFTGDILARIKKRIETAEVVIAELSGANPNVYLEIGYAWGRNRPTILLANDPAHLRFDIQGQRCLVYDGIKNLEGLLTKELLALKSNRLI
jgi:hypothetical protein